MNTGADTMYGRYRILHRLGLTPWEASAIPTRLTRLITGPAALPTGRALDLGCGTGRQALHLASHGWQVTAVDFVPTAIAKARRRPGAEAVTWLTADITRLTDHPGWPGPGRMSLVLDNGCLHGLTDRQRAGWARTVTAAAAPGCVLLVRAAPPRPHTLGPRGISPDDLYDLLGDHWSPDDNTPLPDAHSWHQHIRTRVSS